MWSTVNDVYGITGMYDLKRREGDPLVVRIQITNVAENTTSTKGTGRCRAGVDGAAAPGLRKRWLWTP